VTELACHPGEPDPATDYSAERKIELEALCDRRVADAILSEGVILRSFSPTPAPIGERIPVRSG